MALFRLTGETKKVPTSHIGGITIRPDQIDLFHGSGRSNFPKSWKRIIIAGAGLLDDLDMKTLMDDDVVTSVLRGVEQDVPTLNVQGRLAAQERLGTSREERVNGCSRYEWTVIMTTDRGF